jgi:uncharacterized damage-inducible protein DinB
MTEHVVARLFEHNNWANRMIFQACSTLTAQQLDAEPQSATQGSIRSTLSHLAAAQEGYLRILTRPLDERLERVPAPPFSDLHGSVVRSGEALLALARGEVTVPTQGRIHLRDGFAAEPWVILVQVINHATEHREQIKSMLSALGMEPPSVDGWDYGEFMNAVIPL